MFRFIQDDILSEESQIFRFAQDDIWRSCSLESQMFRCTQDDILSEESQIFRFVQDDILSIYARGLLAASFTWYLVEAIHHFSTTTNTFLYPSAHF